MPVNTAKPISAEPAARPSRPSVTLTAFVVAKMIVPAHSTHTTGPSSQPGKSARVSEIRVSMSVVATSAAAIASDIRYETAPFTFQ